MKFLRPLFLIFISLILASTQVIHNQDDFGDPNERRGPNLSKANMQFAVAFYKIVSSKIARGPPNIFFSPLSLSTSLTMLALGAKSTTRQEILQALSLYGTQADMQELNTEYKKLLDTLSIQREDVELKFGNRFFVEKSTNVVPKYEQDVARYYNASIKLLSFSNPQAAEKKINSYVRSKMDGEIKDLVSNLNAQTKLVLVDLLSCNANLQYPFNAQDTKYGDFTVNQMRTVRVPMLHKTSFFKSYKDTELQSTVVEVPLAGNIILLLIVPKLGNLEKVEITLTPELIKKYLLNTRTSTLDFYMPKIKFEGQIKAEYILLSMGVRNVFSDNADLSGFSEQSRLKVSHKDLRGFGSRSNMRVYLRNSAQICHKGAKTISNRNAAEVRIAKGSHTMRVILVIFVLYGLTLAHCETKGGKSKKEKHKHEIHPTPEKTFTNPLNATTELSAYNISEMNSDFGFNLYRRMADKHDNNIFFSPFSVSFTLASLMLGTQGKTHEQLLSGLNWEAFQKHKHPDLLPTLLKQLREGIKVSDGYSLDLGSFSFVHEDFSIFEEFLNRTKMYFDMEYQNIDFHNPYSKHRIGDMISKKTRGRISELLDYIDPLTKLMCFDFILFKGKWQIPFKPESTVTDTFFINKYNSVKVPMMFKTDEVASMIDKSLSCTVLKLPYRGGAHMLIAMPENEGNFDALEDGLTMELVTRWLEKMESSKTDIFFPKFKLDHKYKLKTSLEELGIKDVFTGKANLTGMTEERNLKLSEASITYRSKTRLILVSTVQL
ncbi:uncharacterized protein LOC142108973 [Mixophyes fleayi]|uniref:uncharacterized protein LOC142108973 n=1 Tax=Mixophyes fleayi TaxID=3061075 RepID=UPI003F4DFB0B